MTAKARFLTGLKRTKSPDLDFICGVVFKSMYISVLEKGTQTSWPMSGEGKQYNERLERKSRGGNSCGN